MARAVVSSIRFRNAPNTPSIPAIDLANASANVKNGAAKAAAVQQQIYNLLKRQ